MSQQPFSRPGAIDLSGLVATGSFGAPDNYVPTIWLSDLPGG